jgi:hypothetical protein
MTGTFDRTSILTAVRPAALSQKQKLLRSRCVVPSPNYVRAKKLLSGTGDTHVRDLNEVPLFVRQFVRSEQWKNATSDPVPWIRLKTQRGIKSVGYGRPDHRERGPPSANIHIYGTTDG